MEEPLSLQDQVRLIAGAAAGFVWLAEMQAGGARGQLFHGQKPITTRAYTRDEAVPARLWAERARLTGASEESFG